MWEWEKRRIFQSWQGQGARVGQEWLDKERRRTATSQEEKLELLEVSALPVSQRGQDHTRGAVGRSTHITALPQLSPFASIPWETSLLPKFLQSQAAFILMGDLLRD